MGREKKGIGQTNQTVNREERERDGESSNEQIF